MIQSCFLPKASLKNRKIRYTLLGVGVIFLSLNMPIGRAFGGTVGIPAFSGREQGLTSISLDYESLEPEISPFQGNSKEERLLLSAGYAPSRFLEITIKFGLAAHETPSRAFSGSLGPAYGLGAKWTFYQRKMLSVGTGFSAVQFSTKDSSVAGSDFRWSELQGYVGGALEGFEKMTPYMGLLLSEGRGRFDNGLAVHLSAPVDFFLGAAFKVNAHFDFLSEVRLISEHGLTLSLVYQP